MTYKLEIGTRRKNFTGLDSQRGTRHCDRRPEGPLMPFRKIYNSMYLLIYSDWRGRHPRPLATGSLVRFRRRPQSGPPCFAARGREADEVRTHHSPIKACFAHHAEPKQLPKTKIQRKAKTVPQPALTLVHELRLPICTGLLRLTAALFPICWSRPQAHMVPSVRIAWVVPV